MTHSIDLRRVLESVADAVIVADPEEKIVYWNAAATRIFGFDAAEALGQTLSLITPERLRHRHSVGFAKTMETGTTRYGTQLLKVPAMHKQGQTLSIAFTVSLMFGEDGKVEGIVAVIRDETQRFLEERDMKRRLAEYAARDAERAANAANAAKSDS